MSVTLEFFFTKDVTSITFNVVHMPLVFKQMKKNKLLKKICSLGYVLKILAIFSPNVLIKRFL